MNVDIKSLLYFEFYSLFFYFRIDLIGAFSFICFKYTYEHSVYRLQSFIHILNDTMDIWV